MDPTTEEDTSRALHPGPGTQCLPAGAYVAGGAGAAVVGGLLAGSQLPQLRAVLEAEPLAAQLDARALLRLLKAFLQARTPKPSTHALS